jgi:hypothetical protein
MLKRLLVATVAVTIFALPGVRADEYDLFPANQTDVVSATINGAIFQTNFMKPTGTGVFNPFLTMQASNNTFEVGYNTDSTSGQTYDDQKITGNPGYTHSLKLSDLQSVTVSGTSYYVFTLDANQQSQGNNFSNAGKLSLLQLQVYLGDTNNPTPNDTTFFDSTTNTTWHYANGFGDGTTTGPVPVYNLDAGGNNLVNLNTAVNNGSGSGDLDVLIPTSAFNVGDTSDKYVYLYSSFGVPDPNGAVSNPPSGGANYYANNDGFEEWSAVTGPNAPNPVPEPSRIALVLSGLVPLCVMGLFRRRKEVTSA